MTQTFLLLSDKANDKISLQEYPSVDAMQLRENFHINIFTPIIHIYSK